MILFQLAAVLLGATVGLKLESKFNLLEKVGL